VKEQEAGRDRGEDEREQLLPMELGVSLEARQAFFHSSSLVTQRS
jgi:hypothetical protein